VATSDESLAAEALKGNLDAFEELVTRYQKTIVKIAYRMVGDRDEAEDIAQEVFLKVYNSIHHFDADKKFAPWIYRIAANTCISRLRRRKKVVLLNFEDSLTRQIEYQNTDYIDPLERLQNEELRKLIMQTLLDLPESYRTVIVLRYQADLTNQEISESLGITKENVEVRIHRARKMLRALLISRLGEGRTGNGLQTSK